MLFKKLVLSCVLITFIVLILGGCSSDEENPVTPTPKPEPPDFALKEVTLPEKMVNSTDTMAQQAISIIESAMSFEGTGCVFAPPTGAEVLAENQTAWEYSWQESNLTKRLAIILISGQYKWQQFFTGTADNNSYDSWRFMDAAQKTDQTIGHVYLYKPVTMQIAQEWSWHTLDNNNYVFKRQSYVEPISKVEITCATDKSGGIESYKPGTTGALVYDLVVDWNADGSGSWRTFQNGMTLANGTWN